MAVFEFRRNALVWIAGEKYRFCEKVGREDGEEGEVWRLEKDATGRLSELSEDELLELLRSGELTYVIEDAPQGKATALAGGKSKPSTGIWDAATEGERMEARRRMAYVSTALAAGPTRADRLDAVRKLSEARKDKRTPSKPTMNRWISSYSRGGRDIVALLPCTRRQGNRTPRIEARLAGLCDEALDDCYLTDERPTLQDTLDRAIVLVERQNRQLTAGIPKLPMPTRRMLQSVLAKRDPYEVCAARYGREYADQKYRLSLGHVRVERGLQRVEIDHTPLNVMVVDDETFLPLDRPVLTVALEWRHRVCLGYALSFEPPSWLSVMRCLQHAILPKTYLRKRYPEIEGEWPCYGLMEELVMDNGKEFHAVALDDLADRYGITLGYCPVKRAWWKGAVERFVGTINRGVAHGKPGTTFADIFERGDYDSAKHACLTLSDLHEIIHRWIVEIYHQRVHRTLGMSPLASWTSEMRRRSIPLPASAIDLEQVLSLPDSRTLTHKGIEIDHLLYNAPACRELLIRAGGSHEVDLRRPPDDVGHLYVLNPRTEQYIRVPVTKRFESYATGLSMWQHACCVRYAKQHYQGRNDAEALAMAKQRIRDVVERSLWRKRGGDKKRSARFKNAGPVATDASVQPMAPPKSPVSHEPPPMQHKRTSQDTKKPEVSYIARPPRRGLTQTA